MYIIAICWLEKGYYLWDPTTHKVVINRNIIFMDNKEQEQAKSDNTSKENIETITI